MTRSTLFALTKLAVSIALLALVMQGIDLSGVQTRLKSASPFGLFLALLCALIEVILAAWRWIIVTEALCGVRMSIGRTVGLAAIGSLVGQVLPSTVGGDVVRIGFLAQVVGYELGARSVIADRLIGLLALSVLALVSVGALLLCGLDHPALLIPVAIAISVLGAAGLLVAIAPFRERLPNKFAAILTPAMDLRKLLSSRSAQFAILVSMLGHLLAIVSFLALAMAISFDEVTPGTLALFVSPSLLVSAVPVSIGGWGVREGAFSAGLATLGVGVNGPIIISVLFGLTAIVSSSLASVCWFLARSPASQPKPSGST